MKITDSQKWLALAALTLFGWLLYLLAPVLTPFFIAALLAYIGDPLADRLQRLGLSRTLAVALVFLLMTLLFTLVALVLLPILQTQFTQLIQTLPQYLAWAQQTVLPWIEKTAQVDLSELKATSVTGWLSGHLGAASGVAAKIFSYLTASGGAVLGWAANLVLIPVVTFYLLRDWDRFIDGIHHLLPRSWEGPVTHVAKESDEMLGAFLRGQILVMLVLGTIYSVGLALAGVKFALLIGILAGVVSFVPYLGVIVGVLVAGVAVLFQTHDVVALLPVLAVFAIGQLVEGMILTPMLVGDRIGLHPVAVIFAVLAGGQLFGFMGILLALPVAAVIAVIVRDLHRRYMLSDIYQTRGDGPAAVPREGSGSDSTGAAS